MGKWVNLAAFILAACAASVECPIHHILSPMVRDSYPNGVHVRTYGHAGHQFDVVCN